VKGIGGEGLNHALVNNLHFEQSIIICQNISGKPSTKQHQKAKHFEFNPWIFFVPRSSGEGKE